jgi:hypothetical protein
MSERYYRGKIRKHLPVEAKTGTPGIEFEVDISQEKNGDGWVNCALMTRRVSLWFKAGGDNSYSLKKLRHAGWQGGGMVGMDLTGNTAELVSKEEEYQGQIREKWDLAFPPREETQVSDSAALAIDAILQSAPIDISQAAQAAPVPTAPAAVPDDRQAAIDEIAEADLSF